MVDRTRDRGRSEPIVDVDDGHSGGAAVEHPEQGCETSETSTIPDTRGYCDNWGADEPPDHTRECALHPGNGDDDLCTVETLPFDQYPMETSDANVIDRLDIVAEEFGTDPGFLGHREV